MRIQNKITLIFTFLTGSLLLGVFILIYYFSDRYSENEFVQRLKERANIIGQSYMEKDELNEKIYDEIRHKLWQKLPEEQETLIQIDTITRTVLKRDSRKDLPDHFFDQIFEKKYAHLKIAGIYYVGILYIDNQGDFIVTVSAKNLFGNAKMNNLRNILMISFFSGLIGVFIIGRYYASKVLKPISVITEKVNEINAFSLDLRLDTGNGKDELAELAVTFNKMLDRLEKSFEIQTNFVSNASHELRNPLTAILGETEVALKKERSVKEYENSLGIIEEEAQRLSLLIDSLLKLAQTGLNHRDQGLNIEPIRIDELLIEIKQNMDTIIPGNRIIFDFTGLPDHPESLILYGNPGLLKVALNNIIDNACKFSMNREVIVKLHTTGDTVDISVKDQGVGIPENDLDHISEPFYRASNTRVFKGFGIGLPLTQKIVRLHGGKMRIHSKAGKGTKVEITLPASQPGFVKF